MKTIENYEDFSCYIENIKKQNSDKELYFRGQKREYDLIPRMLRGDGPNSAPGCIPFLTVNWHICVERLIRTVCKRDLQPIESQAILQHYGYRSFFVDVSSNPAVALWFSLHEFIHKPTPLYINGQLTSAVFHWSRYINRDEGFFYVLNNNERRILDLSTFIDEKAARVHSQCGGAAFCGEGKKNVNDLIIDKIKIIDDGWYRESEINFHMNRLFPSPSQDLFYKLLSTIPYIVPEKLDFKISHALLGEFPIYVENIESIIKEFIPLTRSITQFHPCVTWNVASEVVELDGIRYKARGAKKYIISLIMAEKYTAELSKISTDISEIWYSRNLLIEFQPDASLFNPTESPLDEIIRGLWVVIGEDALKISLITDDYRNIGIGHNCIYSLDNYQLLEKDCDCNDHNVELSIFLHITKMILTGGVTFIEKDGYIHIE